MFGVSGLRINVGVMGFLFLSFGYIFAYNPTLTDKAWVRVMDEVVRERWDTWSDEEKAIIQAKISAVGVATTDDRLGWLVDEVSRIWEMHVSMSVSGNLDTLSLTENGNQQGVVIGVDSLFQVRVVQDGKGALNVRSGPSTNTQVIGKALEGSTWSVYDEFDELGLLWYRIQWESGEGWVLAEFVQRLDEGSVEGGVESGEKIETDIVIKTVEVSPNDVGTLRVRSGPSDEYSILGVVYVGEQFGIYEEKDAYFRINYDGQAGWIAVEYVHLAGTDAPTKHVSDSVKLPPSPPLGGGGAGGLGKKEFLDVYWQYVESKDVEILDLCTKYFDEVDAIAKEYDFPVELIIATWFREHTCKFYNPSNGWGNFQITSNYYAPGEITRGEFRAQVIDFIEFSRSKWEYYDLTQSFGPEPISLSYGRFDLDSIRKQAIYYNGVVGELETNRYANTNFNGVHVGGTDGIVAMFLKVLKWGLER